VLVLEIRTCRLGFPPWYAHLQPSLSPDDLSSSLPTRASLSRESSGKSASIMLSEINNSIFFSRVLHRSTLASRIQRRAALDPASGHLFWVSWGGFLLPSSVCNVFLYFVEYFFSRYSRLCSGTGDGQDGGHCMGCEGRRRGRIIGCRCLRGCMKVICARLTSETSSSPDDGDGDFSCSWSCSSMTGGRLYR
jgi:hypothetical protein